MSCTTRWLIGLCLLWCNGCVTTPPPTPPKEIVWPPPQVAAHHPTTLDIGLRLLGIRRIDQAQAT